jgi:hypothetical protein
MAARRTPHGSDNNVEPEFFETIVANHYVFSGNGKHGNPERETLDMLATARGKSAMYDVYLTYPVADIDKGRKAHFQKHGKTWNPKKHSLKSFFDAKVTRATSSRSMPTTRSRSSWETT